ncbi:MAG: hypothetical protein II938_00440 [Alphaproteobacteria bacterium]|nr:hypothetical protein [Alphaproteobacteria bacterium]
MNKRYLLLCLAILALVSAVVAKEYVPTKDEDGFMANTELTKEKKEEIKSYITDYKEKPTKSVR